MATEKKFTAPQGNPYAPITPDTPNPVGRPKKEQPEEVYRFNLKLPLAYKEYLDEIAWQHRMTKTEYLTHLLEADMAAHPNWRDTLDELNR